MLDIMQPFTRTEARAAGISDRRLAGREFRRVLGSVYVAERVPDHPLIRARAALKVHPPDAARVFGVPVPADPLEHVTVPSPGDRRQRHGLRCHVAALAADEVRVVSGVRIPAPARMFVELASSSAWSTWLPSGTGWSGISH